MNLRWFILVLFLTGILVFTLFLAATNLRSESKLVAAALYITAGAGLVLTAVGGANW